MLDSLVDTTMTMNIFVVGGNGFVGSAVCRAAVRRGWKVQSISKSGKPFATPNGHLPAWTEKVEWHAASAFEPASYRSLISSSSAVVHTLGTLLEGGEYKKSIKAGDGFGTVVAGAKGAIEGLNGGNPLQRGLLGSYESVNRDSAISVCQTYLSETASTSTSSPKRTFVYISAEDVFRPMIPARYITTKREAERMIQDLCSQVVPPARSISIRPSFIYHPHFRPISSPLAAMLQAAGGAHKTLGQLSPFSILSKLLASPPSADLRSDGSTLDGFSDSIQRAVTIPPIHVDHVGEAVCEAIQNGDISGPVGVREMRKLLGWTENENGSDSYVKV